MLSRATEFLTNLSRAVPKSVRLRVRVSKRYYNNSTVYTHETFIHHFLLIFSVFSPTF